MKLTRIEARTKDGAHELIVELDGIHYEAQRWLPRTDAVDFAARLRHLANRIEHRAAAKKSQPAGSDGEALEGPL